MHGKCVRSATIIPLTHSLREKDRENLVRVIYYPVVYKENVGKILQRYIQGEPSSVVSAKNTCTTFSN